MRHSSSLLTKRHSVAQENQKHFPKGVRLGTSYKCKSITLASVYLVNRFECAIHKLREARPVNRQSSTRGFISSFPLCITIWQPFKRQQRRAHPQTWTQPRSLPN